MIPGNFEYSRPGSVAEAAQLLKDGGSDALLIAGGHSLIPMMKVRMAAPSRLVDLGGIGELKGIEISGGTIRIGAMVTQHELIASGELAAACPILREASLTVADPQVRYCGTVGGNSANGDPGNDLPAVMQALDAEYELVGAEGSRKVRAREYYEGAYFTVRQDDEILSSISMPVPAAGHGWAYDKQKRKIGDYATAAVAVILSSDGGKLSGVSIGLTNVGDTPLHAADASAALEGSDGGDAAVAEAAGKAAEITNPAADGRGPAEFRRHLVGVLAARAIRAAIGRAAG